MHTYTNFYNKIKEDIMFHEASQKRKNQMKNRDGNKVNNHLPDPPGHHRQQHSDICSNVQEAY